METTRDFYEVAWRVFIHRNKEMKQALKTALLDRALYDSSAPGWVRKIDEIELDLYAIFMLGEVLTGSWAEECNEIKGPCIGEFYSRDFIPCFRDYVHDVHTLIGKMRWKKVFHQILPNKKLPEKVDPRWSGMVIRLLWRHLAWEQYGEKYKEVPWEAVKIEQEIWDKTVEYNRWWYPKWYKYL